MLVRREQVKSLAGLRKEVNCLVPDIEEDKSNVGWVGYALARDKMRVEWRGWESHGLGGSDLKPVFVPADSDSSAGLWPFTTLVQTEMGPFVVGAVGRASGQMS